MKRFLQFVIALPVFMAMLLSCNDETMDERAVVSIQGLNNSYQFEAIPDGKVSFTIKSNVNWHLELDGLDWIKVKPGRGLASSSAQTVVLEALVNEDNQPREGVMTVVAGDVKREVQLSQNAASLTPELKFVEGVASDGIFYIDSYNIYGAQFKLYSNVDWTADAGEMDEWATVGPLQGEGKRYATMAVTPSEVNGGDDIFGEIRFSYADQTKTLRVCQKKFAAEITVLDEEGASVSSVPALSIGDQFDLQVKSNAPWEVSTTASWVTFSAYEGGYGLSTITISAELNETGANRTADMVFDNNGTKTTVKVTQGNQFISVSESSLVVNKDGGNFNVDLTSNVKWSAQCSEDWLSVAPATGNGNASLTVTVTAAPSDDARVATVKVVADDLPEIYKEINIVQSATFVDLTTPVMFLASDQAWNMEHNPDFASRGETGAVTGLGTGRLCSYTYPDNQMLYVQMVTPSQYGLKYIIAKEGNITMKTAWTKDAIEFHIPVLKAEKNKVLHFDYGMAATLDSPKYWRSEISLDGGSKWTAFTTGLKEDAPNGESANCKLPGGKSKTEVYYNATFTMTKTVEKGELIVRIICVDGTYLQSDKTATSPSTSGAIRFIGADHPHDESGVFKGPTFQLK